MRDDELGSLAQFAAGHPRLSGLIAGLTHGLCLALAFPPIGLWGFVFLAPLPLVLLGHLTRRRSFLAAFWCGIGMAPWWLLGHIWVVRVSAFGLVPLVITLSACTGLAVYLGAFVQRRAAWMLACWPIIWVGCDFFRGAILADGYAWYFLAHPLAETSVLNWPAAILGTYAVTLLVTLPATACVLWLIHMRAAATSLTAVSAVWVLLGFVVDPWPSASRTLKVAVVQTNVPQDVKLDWSMTQRFDDLQAMRRLIIAAAQDGPDVIVLPESMCPGWTLDAESLELERQAGLFFEYQPADSPPWKMEVTTLADELIALQGALGIPIVIGGPGYEGLELRPDDDGFWWYEADKNFNSVFVIEDGRAPTKRYDKIALTPFGEYMPYIGAWPWLEHRLLGLGARGMSFGLDPGQSTAPLTVSLGEGGGEVVRLATPVCFEATRPAVCRRLVGPTGHADAMFNLTNDGWFGSWKPGKEHHLLTARWRCIELGVSMVRAANTGISCAIDQRGQVLASGALDIRTGERVESNREGVLLVDLPLTDGRTIYARIGDIVGWACLGVCAGLVALSAAAARSSRRGDRTPSEPEAR